MQLLQKAGIVLTVGGAVAIAMLMTQIDTAQARPQYKKAFEAKYGESIKKVDCTICHPAKGSKKERNVYGKAFGKALAAKNEMETSKINKALDSVENKESQVEGTTFGELIKEGKSPATKPKKKK